MNRLEHVKKNMLQRKRRVRSVIQGTPERPRLSVHISNNHITAQIINDQTGKTLVYVSTIGRKSEGSMTDKAALIGKEVAKKAKAAKINQVVLDRGSKLYHGRVKKLAETARQEGLEF